MRAVQPLKQSSHKSCKSTIERNSQESGIHGQEQKAAGDERSTTDDALIVPMKAIGENDRCEGLEGDIGRHRYCDGPLWRRLGHGLSNCCVPLDKKLDDEKWFAIKADFFFTPLGVWVDVDIIRHKLGEEE